MNEFNIETIILSQKHNRLDLYVFNEFDINNLNGMIPADVVNVIYQEQNYGFYSTYTMSGGDLLDDDASGSPSSKLGSLGCAVMYNMSGTPARGFLTAAHVVDYPGQEIYYGGAANEITPVYLGTVLSYPYYKCEGTVDACIIDDDSTTDTFNFSGKTGDGRLIQYQRTAPLPSFTLIYAYGASSGALSGTITDNAYSFTISDVSFSNFYLTSLGAQIGDSGCPVVYAYNGSYSMVGIVTGGNSSGTLVCQIQEINNTFNSSVSQ